MKIETQSVIAATPNAQNGALSYTYLEATREDVRIRVRTAMKKFVDGEFTPSNTAGELIDRSKLSPASQQWPKWQKCKYYQGKVVLDENTRKCGLDLLRCVELPPPEDLDMARMTAHEAGTELPRLEVFDGVCYTSPMPSDWPRWQPKVLDANSSLWLACPDMIEAIEAPHVLPEASVEQLQAMLSASPQNLYIQLMEFLAQGMKAKVQTEKIVQSTLAIPAVCPVAPVKAMELDGLPAFENLKALVDDTSVVLPAQVIMGLLHLRELMSFGGSSKAGKSWGLMLMCMAVANGKVWMGQQCQKGKVLYLNFELDRSWARKRFIDLIEAEALTSDALADITIANLRGYSCDMEMMLPELLERVKGAGYTLIVIDPIYQAMGERDENDGKDVAAILKDADKIARVSNAAVAFGAHFTKALSGGKRQIDRQSGHGTWARFPDVLATLTEHENDSALVFEATCRNVAKPISFCVEWKWPLFIIRSDLDPTHLKTDKPSRFGRKPSHTPADMVKLLVNEPLTTTEWEDVAADKWGLSKSTFMRLKRAATKQGLVEEIGRGWQPATGKK
jgi:hypothetical protein